MSEFTYRKKLAIFRGHQLKKNTLYYTFVDHADHSEFRMLDKTHDAKEIYLLNACDIPSHYHYVTMQTIQNLECLTEHTTQERDIFITCLRYSVTLSLCVE